VDATSARLGEHGTAVRYDERLVAGECGVQIGNDADKPAAARPVGFKRRRAVLFVAWAEGARATRVRLDLGGAYDERLRPISASGADHHPATREWVEPQLASLRTRTGWVHVLRSSVLLCLAPARRALGAFAFNVPLFRRLLEPWPDWPLPGTRREPVPASRDPVPGSRDLARPASRGAWPA